MSENVLTIEDLRLTYGETAILRGVTLSARVGETVGLVGESGSGKSSTARAVLRLLPRNAGVAGRISVRDKEVLTADTHTLHGIRANDVGFIQQDPRNALNPVRRIGDSLTERLVKVHSISASAAAATGRDLLEAVGITRVRDRMRQYPHELSGGMLQRVVIAAALTTRPSLLLADEATSALDVTTQAEVLAILRDQQRERGLGILFITHDLRLASAFCDRVYVMLAGRIVEELRGPDLFDSATHPYTVALLSAMPGLSEESR